MRHIVRQPVKALLGATCMLLLGGLAPVRADGDLPRPEEVVTPTVFTSLSALHPGGRMQVAVAGDVLDGWHVNAHLPSADYLIPTAIEVDGGVGLQIGEATYPPGEMVTFEFADDPLKVYQGRFYVVFSVAAAPDADTGPRRLSGKLDYQPCSTRICLPPAEVTFSIEIPVVSLTQPVTPQWPEVFAQFGGVVAAGTDSAPGEGAGAVEGATPLVFLALFLGGLALNLTPCVYPLIPITLGFFGGQVGRSTLGTFGLASLYVLGMATTYSTMGVVVALTGGMFGAALQNPWVLSGVGGILILLSLSQFGLYEFRIPGTQRLGSRRGAAGAYLMGLVVGVVAAPCLGPFVLGLLVTVAQEGNAVLGFWKFFVLSLGLGTPYLFLGGFSAGLSLLPRAGEWMDGIKHLFGHALLATAAWFIGQSLPGPYGFWLLPASLTASALWLVFYERSSRAAWFVAVRTAVALVAISLAAWWVWPAGSTRLAFDDYSARAVDDARDQGKPVLLDFTADWCVPCREYEHNVFTDPRVIDAAADLITLQADLTRTSSSAVQDLIAKYDIYGPPTILFIDAGGKERRDLRLVGYVGPERFAERIRQLTSGTGVPESEAAISF
ncbi:MAG: cytochrome c biogenesis protein CcdA [Acidobacteriota bacterium]